MNGRSSRKTTGRNWLGAGLLLLLLAASVTGCGTSSTVVIDERPTMPPPPADLMEPPPSEKFSERALRSMKRWREMLMPSPTD